MLSLRPYINHSVYEKALDNYPMGVYYSYRITNTPLGYLGGAGMDETMRVNTPAERKKVRDENERRDLMNRLKRIEGQVRGLQRMLEEIFACPIRVWMSKHG